MSDLSRRDVLRTTAAAGGALTLGTAPVSAGPDHERLIDQVVGDDDGNGDDGDGCDIVVDQGGDGDFVSIQAAVDAASAGDAICVKPGDYEEQVTVDTEGLILFANRGPDHTTITASGTVVDVTAPDVVLIRFTIGALSGTAVDAGLRTGLRSCRLVTGDTTGVRASEDVFLVSNEFEDVGVKELEGVGVDLAGVRGTPESNTDGAFIVRNTFKDHRYALQVTDSSEVLVRRNRFVRARWAAVEVVADAAEPARTYLFEDNTFERNANGIILLERGDDSRIERVKVEGNTFDDYVWGILTSTELVPWDVDRDGDDELVPAPGPLSGGTVFGTCNFWGDPTGPNHGKNRASRRNWFTRQALKTNDKVSPGVDYRPWAVQPHDPDEELACVGGLGGDAV